MFRWLKSIFKKPEKQPTEENFIWCIVGNIIDEHLVGEEQELKRGTKHFSPGTKVFCFPPLWGDGYEKVKVIGLHRKSKKQICIIMPSKHITNWRMKKVYDPSILKIMQAKIAWRDHTQHKENLTRLIESLNNHSGKINP